MNLNICCWNCNGLSDDKFIFLRKLSNDLDIIVLCETWLKPDFNFTFVLPNFVYFASSRRKLNPKAKRGAGGVLVYIRKDWAHLVKLERMGGDVDDRIWIKISAGHMGTLFFGAWYIPPKGTTGLYNSHLYWEVLTEEIAGFRMQGSVMVVGDLNARTGNLPISGGRVSQDRMINDYGKILLEVCAEHDLVILNGLVDSNHSSKFTCVTPRGASVVDYAILDKDASNCVTKFSIGSPTTISDHATLNVTLCLRSDPCKVTLNKSKALLADIILKNGLKGKEMSKEVRYRWNEEKKETWVNFLDGSEWLLILEKIHKCPDINEKLFLFQQNLLDTAIECGCVVSRHVNQKNGKQRPMPKYGVWFDGDCREAKRSFRKAVRKWKQNPRSQLLTDMMERKRNFKYLCKKKKSMRDVFVQQKLHELHKHSGRDFWKIVNGGDRSRTAVPDNISMDAWYQYFKSLHQTDVLDTHSLQIQRSTHARCDI